MEKKYKLSKSLYIRGLQCEKSLWLYKHKPDERQEPDNSQQAIFDTGTYVGELARELFPGGELIDFSYDKIGENIKKTKDLIESGAEVIYEATFVYNDVLIMVDILHKSESGWEIIEVKSSTEVKDVHLSDAAIQYYVLTGSGYEVSRTSIIYINNEYIRQGDLNLNELFVIEDVSQPVLLKQKDITGRLNEYQEILAGPESNIDIGIHCSEPYPCDFHNYCWKDIPENTVFNLSNMRKKRKFSLYDRGIIKFSDIPVEEKLTYRQQIQILAEKEDREVVNKDSIALFLDFFVEPIGFLDFETFTEAVPAFDLQKPYQQIPFQYSLHIIENGNKNHKEFLGIPGEDPRKAFIERLIADIASCKSVVVYNKAFEETRLKELKVIFPEHSASIDNIIEKMVDLMVPFRDVDYYTKEMKGSYSIKYVLPALDDLSYDSLDISNGMMAMNAYKALNTAGKKEEIDKTRKQLKAYCAMDTLAMVKIWEKLRLVVQE